MTEETALRIAEALEQIATVLTAAVANMGEKDEAPTAVIQTQDGMFQL